MNNSNTAMPSSVHDNVFKDLWNHSVNAQLPSPAWATHHISGKTNIICFSEMIVISETNCVIRKKLTLTEHSRDFYVFDCCVTNNDNIPHTDENICLKSLEELLQRFNNMSVCLGGPKLFNCPANFNNTSYKIDNILQVWRHIRCPLLISNEEGKIQNTCNYCKITRKT